MQIGKSIEQSTVKNATLAFLGGVVALRVLNNKNIALQNFEKDYLTPLASTLTPQEKEALKFAFQNTLNISNRQGRGSLYEKIKLCLALKEYDSCADQINIDFLNTHKFHDAYIGYVGDRGIIHQEIIAGIVLQETGEKRAQRTSLLNHVHEKTSALDILLKTHPQIALDWKIFFYTLLQDQQGLVYQEKVYIDALKNIATISPQEAIRECSDYRFVNGSNLYSCVFLVSLIANMYPSEEEIELIRRIDALKDLSEPYSRWSKTAAKATIVTYQNELLYQKGKAWVCLDEELGIAMMKNAMQYLGKMHNLWRDVALQLIRSNTKRAKHIAHYTLTNPEDKKVVFDAIARDMLLGITKPTPDMAQAMHEQILNVIPLLAPNNPEKALEYLRQQNPVFIPQYMPHIVASLTLTNPQRAQELYEEVIKLADTPVHKDNRAMIIGNITAARFGIPPFGNEG
jgi:hypothetical protein